MAAWNTVFHMICAGWEQLLVTQLSSHAFCLLVVPLSVFFSIKHTNIKHTFEYRTYGAIKFSVVSFLGKRCYPPVTDYKNNSVQVTTINRLQVHAAQTVYEFVLLFIASFLRNRARSVCARACQNQCYLAILTNVTIIHSQLLREPPCMYDVCVYIYAVLKTYLFVGFIITYIAQVLNCSCHPYWRINHYCPWPPNGIRLFTSSEVGKRPDIVLVLSEWERQPLVAWILFYFTKKKKNLNSELLLIQTTGKICVFTAFHCLFDVYFISVSLHMPSSTIIVDYNA